MNFKKILSEAIDNNSKIIITGRSGWGKSEMIKQVAEDKGFELIDFRLSEVLPEDIVGIPKVRDNYYEYVPPLWLYNVLQNPEKKYLLFLDEITQGTPEVLNICYKIFDKVTKIGDHELPNVAVVGATNYKDESNYLSELPEPLKKRACMLELDHNEFEASKYLMEKYNFTDVVLNDTIAKVITKSNPRSTDKAIELILNDCCKELVIPYIGMESYKQLASLLTLSKSSPDSVSDLSKAVYDINQGYTMYNSEKYVLNDVDILSYVYNLDAEEKDVVYSCYKNKKTAVGDDLRRDFFTQYALDAGDVPPEMFKELGNTNSFNPIKYIKHFKIIQSTFDDQLNALSDLLNYSKERTLRQICTDRTLPLGIMKKYRDALPWDLIAEQASKGWLTDAKMKEFAKELSNYGI